jgi:hypothetical protein
MLATAKSIGVRSLVPVCQAPSSPTSCGEVGVEVAQHRLDRSHRVRGGIVRGEMAHKLGGEEAVHLGVVGKERQRGNATGFIGWELLLHHRLYARLMRKRAAAEAGRISLRSDRPAGQDVGERCDVDLAVACRGADGVQFQALARQVFVQPAMGALPDRAVGGE